MRKFLFIGGGVSLIALFSFIWAVATYNRSISLENQFKAAVSSREALYDNMVKQVVEKFGVAKYERQSIVSLIDNAVQGRSGGAMFKSVQEQYPQVSETMFKEVMATIGGKRDEFTRSQQLIMDIKREHDNLRMQVPSSLVVGGRSELVYVIVSSTDAKETMKTGVDDKPIINP